MAYRLMKNGQTRGFSGLNRYLKRTENLKQDNLLDTVKLILFRPLNQKILPSEDFMMQGTMDLEIISLCMVSVEWNTM